MMAKDVLYGDGLDSGESKGDDPESDSDDADLAELGAKYAERLGNALKDGDWAEAYKAFARISCLQDYEEDQERGY